MRSTIIEEPSCASRAKIPKRACTGTERGRTLIQQLRPHQSEFNSQSRRRCLGGNQSHAALHPRSPLVFCNLTRGRPQHHRSLFDFRTSEAITVSSEKDRKGRERCSLIAIGERMIAQDGPCKRRSQTSRRLDTSVCFKVLRPADRCFQRILIADAVQTAVGLDQPVVNISQYIGADPYKAHFASSR